MSTQRLMRIMILAIAIPICSMAAHTGTHTVKQNHPRLWLTPEVVAEAEWKRDNNTEEWQNFLAYADDAMTRLRWDWPYQVQVLALAWRFTGDSTYARRVLDVFDQPQGALNNETVWDFSYAGSNQYRWYYYAIPLVFDWMYDYIEAQGKTADFLTLMSTACDVHLNKEMRYEDSDDLVSVARNLGLTGIAAYYEDPTNAEKYLTYGVDDLWFGENGIDTFLIRGLCEGGVWAEGSSYNLHTSQFLYQLRNGVISALGIDLFDGTTFPRDMVYAIIHQGLPKEPYVYPFYDIEAGTLEDPNGDFFGSSSTQQLERHDCMLKALSALSPTSPEAGYAIFWNEQTALAHGSEIDELLWKRHDISPVDYRNHIATDFYAPGLRFLFSRSDWSTDATYMGFQCRGHVVDHMHWDALSFNIMRKGVWVTKEVTTYNAYDTDCHNTLLIENKADGRQCPYGFERDGFILKRESKDNHAYIVGDASGLYNMDPSTWQPDIGCEKARRNFVYLKPDIFVIYDYTSTLESAGSRWKKYLFHTQNKPVISGNIVSDVYDGQKIYSATLLPVDYAFARIDESTHYADKESYEVAASQMNWRLDVTSQDPTDRVETFLHVLYTCDDGEDMPTASLIVSDGDAMVGTQIETTPGQVVMFSRDSNAVVEDATYPVSVSGAAQHLLFDMKPLFEFDIFKDGVLADTRSSSKNGVLAFDADGGSTFRVTAKGAVGSHRPSALDVQTATPRMQFLAGRPDGVVTVKYSVDRPGQFALNLYNSEGRLVCTRTVAVPSAGTHTAVIAKGSLPPGHYIVSLNGPGVKSRVGATLIR